MKEYRNGAEGFFKWVEDFGVSIPIYEEGSDIVRWVQISKLPTKKNKITGKSYAQFWEAQKEVCRDALQMENGRFRYRLVVFCWQRGEGKSMLACLIELWRFFCWPRQQIMLGANSRDQVKFVHYDIMRDVIINSTKLLHIIGKKNIQEKEIRMTDMSGNVRSVIRCISSFSGIVSNISGYTFSEMFDMKLPKFFVQLDGSIRNIPNAMGAIDSTVSSKTHQLYKLYEAWKGGKDKSIFFSYRYSKEGDIADYWNPNMTEEQLSSYRGKFPLIDFQRYFLNLWSSSVSRIFAQADLDAIGCLGVDERINVHSELTKLLTMRNEVTEVEKGFKEGIDEKQTFTYAPYKAKDYSDRMIAKIREANDRIQKVGTVYSLMDSMGQPVKANEHDIDVLSDMYQTNWAVLVGLDRADPMKGSRNIARTIIVTLLKGCIGSKNDPFKVISDEGAHSWLYFVVDFVSIYDHSMDKIKQHLLDISDDLDGIDSFGAERWGTTDMLDWLLSNNITHTIYSPTYEKQKAMFTELTLAIQRGLFKAPSTGVPGSRSEDVLIEELSVFDHNPEASKSKFGSPEKTMHNGIQDDAVYAIGAALFGGKAVSLSSFRERRRSKLMFGEFYKPLGLVGKW